MPRDHWLRAHVPGLRGLGQDDSQAVDQVPLCDRLQKISGEPDLREQLAFTR